jgi:ABC-type sugar transport system permease subunit
VPAAEPRTGLEAREARLAGILVAPAVAVVLLVALFPILWTAWESLHRHDLRLPWLGQPFLGPANYVELLGDARFRQALGHTLFFTAGSVTLELALGLALALAMHRAVRGRTLVRAAVLVPWALPTVVSALLWRFIFEGPAGLANRALAGLGMLRAPVVWLAEDPGAWVPILAADVWKSTPFVALLLLAGLQSIDPGLYEAARIDGASAWQRFRWVTLPLLRPALLVAVVFRSLDALRVFDLIYVLTGGGPGTATEPIALYTFDTLFQRLRFGYGSALSMVVFVLAFLLALAYVRVLGAAPGTRGPERAA